MTQENNQGSFIKVLRPIMLVILGSGLIGNAIYIYGLGYYTGYIERLGFDYNLFPIDWNDSIFWSYIASREFSSSSIDFIVELAKEYFLVIVFVVYLIIILLMHLYGDKSILKGNPIIEFIADYFRKIQEENNWIYKFIYSPLHWLLVQEKSIKTFAASYLIASTLILFIPLLLFIWLYFPIFGLNHGTSVATKRIAHYEKYLCGKEKDYWSECVEVTPSHLDENSTLSTQTGRIIVKNDSLIGLLTKDGPVTLTLPKDYFYKAAKNPLYKSKKN